MGERAYNPNAIGSIVPPFGADDGSGPPPPGEIDYFAPKYLVGNVLNGDDATPHSAGGFVYIPDPGDGSGIAAALAEALVVAGDIWLRPGTYTRAAGLARFVLPAGVAVRGAGTALTNIITNNADDCIFQLGAGCSLERLGLTQRGVLAGVGSALVECPAGAALSPTRLKELVLTTPVNVRGAQLVGGQFDVDDCVVSFTGGGAAPAGINVEGAADNPAFFNVRNSKFSLVNIAVRFGFAGGGTAVRDSLVEGCRMALANAIVPIAAGAGADRCQAALNVSRGSGSTLPTDAGTNNSVNPGVANYWGP